MAMLRQFSEREFENWTNHEAPPDGRHLTELACTHGSKLENVPDAEPQIEITTSLYANDEKNSSFHAGPASHADEVTSSSIYVPVTGKSKANQSETIYVTESLPLSFSLTTCDWIDSEQDQLYSLPQSCNEQPYLSYQSGGAYARRVGISLDRSYWIHGLNSPPGEQLHNSLWLPPPPTSQASVLNVPRKSLLMSMEHNIGKASGQNKPSYISLGHGICGQQMGEQNLIPAGGTPRQHENMLSSPSHHDLEQTTGKYLYPPGYMDREYSDIKGLDSHRESAADVRDQKKRWRDSGQDNDMEQNIEYPRKLTKISGGEALSGLQPRTYVATTVCDSAQAVVGDVNYHTHHHYHDSQRMTANEKSISHQESFVNSILAAATKHGINIPAVPLAKDRDEVSRWVREVIEANMCATTIWDGQTTVAAPSSGSSLEHIELATVHEVDRTHEVGGRKTAEVFPRALQDNERPRTLFYMNSGSHLS